MKHVFIVVLFILVCATSRGQLLNLSLDGIVAFNETKLVVDEAGEDIDAILSSNSVVYLSVSSSYYWNLMNANWRIYVQRTNIDWDEDIKLEMKRRGQGWRYYIYYYYYYKGDANISDGSSFIGITDNPTYFCSGKGMAYEIPLKFRIKNLSLAMGANDFETDVIFTIYDD